MQLKPQQLQTIKRLLKDAHGLIADSQAIFYVAGAADEAERLKDIVEAIVNELESVDRLLTTQP